MSGFGIRASYALYGEPFLQAARTLIISQWHHHGTPRCRLGELLRSNPHYFSQRSLRTFDRYYLVMKIFAH
jgi:hypothetical protein